MKQEQTIVPFTHELAGKTIIVPPADSQVIGYVKESDHRKLKDTIIQILDNMTDEEKEAIALPMKYAALQEDYRKLKDYFQDILSNTALTPHEKIDLLRAGLTP